MEFDETELLTTLMIKDRKIYLSPEFLAYVINCPNEGVEHYFSHKEVPYEGYIRDRAIKELMGGKFGGMDVSKMDVVNRVLLLPSTRW